MRRFLLIGPLIALLFCPSWQARPQGPPAPGLKRWPNRYEGLVDRPNAKADYEIRGFFAYRDTDNAIKDGDLRLMYYVPAGASIASFQVAEIISETQYQMTPLDGALAHAPGAWNSFTNWPVGDVIVPKHVDPNNLGAVVHMRSSAQPDLLAPVLLYSASTAPTAISEYRLYLLSRRALRTVQCTVAAGGATRACTTKPSLLAINSGMPVAFALNVKDLPAGPVPVAVRIEGEYANNADGDSLEAEIHFVHARLKP